jgi:hypothetical protein
LTELSCQAARRFRSLRFRSLRLGTRVATSAQVLPARRILALTGEYTPWVVGPSRFVKPVEDLAELPHDGDDRRPVPLALCASPAVILGKKPVALNERTGSLSEHLAQLKTPFPDGGRDRLSRFWSLLGISHFPARRGSCHRSAEPPASARSPKAAQSHQRGVPLLPHRAFQFGRGLGPSGGTVGRDRPSAL